MLRAQNLYLLLIAAILAAGCSGAGSSATANNEGEYRDNLGTADPQTLVEETREALLVRYGFQLQREVTTTEDVRFETEWKEETALEDEQATGATHARTRITITARPRNRSTSSAQSYSVRYVAETELKPLGGDYRDAAMTPMRMDYVKQIASYLKSEYRTALR